MLLLKGSDFLPKFFHLESCHINTSLLHISAECTYPMDSIATGFYIIITWSSNVSRIHKLYVNQTLPGQTSASVEVEESGGYLVSILPIIGETGIIDSDVEYRKTVSVDAGKIPRMSFPHIL